MRTSPEEIEKQLGTALETSGSLNGIADLLALASPASVPDLVAKPPQLQHKAIYALYRVFTLLFTTKKLDALQPDPSLPAQTVRQWLLQKLDQFLSLLTEQLYNSEPSISSASLQVSLSLFRQRSAALFSSNGNPQIHTVHFRTIVRGVLCPPPHTTVSDATRKEFIDKFIKPYDDLRWFFFREINYLLQERQAPPQSLLETALWTLERLVQVPSHQKDIHSFFLPNFAHNKTATLDSDGLDMDDPIEENDWRAYFDESDSPNPGPSEVKERRASKVPIHEALHSVKAHRVQFTYAWLSLLQYIKNSPRLSSRVLAILHRSVMPHLTRPVLLMDWIVTCVDFGGSIALLALNTLFILIRDHNLDYPDFYTRVYALLDRSILHVRYRARFFRLLELFLSSTHLPATLLASFVKRLARLSLTASPAATTIIFPFVYNILKRHPSLMLMVHREIITNTFEDPFLPDEPSPLQTRAIDSSLWELQTHVHHYAPPVATLARIFSEPFTKPSYVLEDFLDHTYDTLFVADTKRPIIRAPALTLQPRKFLFINPQEDHANTMDILPDLWNM